MRLEPRPVSDKSSSALVTKAALRAADRLNIKNKFLSRILGVSEPTVSRMRSGEFLLEKKPYELGVLFVRLYRSLDAVVGGDDNVARAWLRNRNSALKAPPIELIQTVSGLIDVLQYVDARRAII